ncbi:exodeoxyribonuclease VII small subunit [Pseudooceanicola aestuarii]|uniref:exodeoxyribonuclease VII small subunit n=1 Tax=Pseudooceanicola aestuarii TaxID=2697319 RepID=UPI0013D49160|nr:exodeoxyribonuclease VII small subunit [Pseudooceanicola aestuarii]
MPDQPSDQPIPEMSFEQAMKELEGVVTQLENGEVALEQSIALYERGALLKKHCDAKLAEAEEKVRLITTDGDGSAAGLKPAEGL